MKHNLAAPPLTDDELVLSAEELFLELDLREAEDSLTPGDEA
jgi:hypothetical protein